MVTVVVLVACMCIRAYESEVGERDGAMGAARNGRRADRKGE